MNRVAFAILFGWSALVSAEDRPNIVIVLADDMGFSDIGCYGGEIETPNLDKLAANGLRFTQFYNTARCCPTRASLLTGLYSHQAGIGYMTDDYGLPGYQGRLNDRCITIAEALGQSGYRTFAAGKWHVGATKPNWPLQRGFDEFFGTPEGGGFYFPEALKLRDISLYRGNEPIEVNEDWYITDLLGAETVQFIDQASNRDKPFFIYLANIAPHWPLQAREVDIAKYSQRYNDGPQKLRQERLAKQQQLGLAEHWTLSEQNPEAPDWESLNQSKKAELARRMAVYAAQVDVMDRNIGRVVDALKTQGELENTLFLFLSDNGGCAEHIDRGEAGAKIGSPESYTSYRLPWANASNTPFRLFKHFVHEGGISSPLVVHWPNGFKGRGELRHQVAHVIDLMPTCLDAAWAEYPTDYDGKKRLPPEGMSLLHACQTNSEIDRTIFWEHEGNRAVRRGDWKLVSRHSEPWELYDLATDRAEEHDLSNKKPDLKSELLSQYEAWAERAGVEPWPVKRGKK